MSISSLLKPFRALFRRFHFTLFIVLMVASLSGAVLVLNNLLTEESIDDGYTSSIGGGSIDQETLERIKSLHTSDEGASPFTPPQGRTNPFAE